MKKLLIALHFAVLTVATSAGASECPVLLEGSYFKLEQIFFTVGSDFDLKIDGKPAGQIVEKYLNFGTTFELRNEKGQLVAKAHKRVLTVGSKVDVYDCAGKPIGALQENVLTSFLTAKVYTIYSIFDDQEQLVGQSEKLDLLGTDISFYDASNQRLAVLSRPYVNMFTDEWTLRVHNFERIDPKVMLFAAAYKTSANK